MIVSCDCYYLILFLRVHHKNEIHVINSSPKCVQACKVGFSAQLDGSMNDGNAGEGRRSQWRGTKLHLVLDIHLKEELLHVLCRAHDFSKSHLAGELSSYLIR